MSGAQARSGSLTGETFKWQLFKSEIVLPVKWSGCFQHKLVLQGPFRCCGGKALAQRIRMCLLWNLAPQYAGICYHFVHHCMFWLPLHAECAPVLAPVHGTFPVSVLSVGPCQSLS